MELGQMFLSNTPVLEYDVPELFEAALRALGDEIERVEWNRTQKSYEAPLGNVGGEYSTDAFKMNSYCWCDGERHKNGCPTNFKWRDLEVNWYKYLGRGMSANKEITPDMTSQMLTECLASVRSNQSTTKE